MQEETDPLLDAPVQPRPKVLLIDDEPSLGYSFRRVLEARQIDVLLASSVGQGLAAFRKHNPDVVILDLNLPDGSGMDIFQEIREANPKCPVVFITAHGTAETALEAMKQGAFDYLIKPVHLDRLLQLLGRALDSARLMQQPSVLPIAGNEGRIIGRSAAMQEMSKDIGLLAPQDVNVLILGESGTGKELVARALYLHSRRADKPFLAINCAAIPETLLESELFGHEQGAFTGADRRRIGKFEQCRDGTLFLDEIGDMPPGIQAKMLRVLQDQRFERLGGNQPVQTQVRLLAATNRNLENLVNNGRFRADLYFRLRVATVSVPPLRERGEDVVELAYHFLFLFNRRFRLNLQGFAPEVLDSFQHYPWPGNVRELQSVIKEAMVRTRGHIIMPEYLTLQLRHPEQPGEPKPESSTETGLIALYRGLRESGEGKLYARLLREVDRVVLAEAMEEAQGEQVRASEILGIDRKTLRAKLRLLGMQLRRVLLNGTAPSTDDNGDGLS